MRFAVGSKINRWKQMNSQYGLSSKRYIRAAQALQAGYAPHLAYLMIVAGIILIGMFALLLVVLSVNPNQYKSTLIEFAENLSDTEVEINAIAWNIFPTLALELKQVTLFDQRKAKAFEVDKIRVRVGLWPLLQRQLQLKHLQFIAPKIHYQNYGDQGHSWSSFLQLSVEQLKQQPQFENGQLPVSWALQTIQITDGKVLAGNGQPFLHNIHAKLEKEQFGPLSQLQYSFAYPVKSSGTQPPDQSTQLNGSAQLNLGRLTKYIDIKNLEFRISKTLAGKRLKLSLLGAGRYRTDDHSFTLEPLNLKTRGVDIDATLVGKSIATKPEIKMTIAPQRVNEGLFSEPWLSQLLNSRYLVDYFDAAKIGGEIIFSDDGYGGFLSPFDFDGHAGRLKFVYAASTQSYDIHAKFAYFDFTQVLKTRRRIRVIAVGEDGRPIVEGFSPERKQQPDTESIRPKLTRDSKTPQLFTLPFPYKLLQESKVDLQLEVGDFIHQAFKLKRLKLDLNAEQGRINVNSFSAKIFDGDVAFAGFLDLQNTPSLQVTTQATKVDIGELLRYSSGDDWVQGRFDYIAKLHSTGDTLQTLYRNLNGTVRVEMVNGAFPGINFQKMLFTALSDRNQQLPLQQQFNLQRTNMLTKSNTLIDNLIAELEITPKSLHSQRLMAIFNDDPIDGSLRLSRSKQGLLGFEFGLPASTRNSTAQDLHWPIRCASANFAPPNCRLDLQTLVGRLSSFPASQRQIVENMMDAGTNP